VEGATLRRQLRLLRSTIASGTAVAVALGLMSLADAGIQPPGLPERVLSLGPARPHLGELPTGGGPLDGPRRRSGAGGSATGDAPGANEPSGGSRDASSPRLIVAVRRVRSADVSPRKDATTTTDPPRSVAPRPRRRGLGTGVAGAGGSHGRRPVPGDAPRPYEPRLPEQPEKPKKPKKPKVKEDELALPRSDRRRAPVPAPKPPFTPPPVPVPEPPPVPAPAPDPPPAPSPLVADSPPPGAPPDPRTETPPARAGGGRATGSEGDRATAPPHAAGAEPAPDRTADRA
jgi:hypothetical protein